MPLLDHFHPPLAPARSWEGFHAAWLGSLSDALNRSLPSGFFAEEQVHVGPSVEIDVATFESGDQPPAFEPYTRPGGSLAVATAPAVYVAPPPAGTVETVFADDYEIKVIGDRSGRHLVAAIELVSPTNKASDDDRRAFAAMCASYLYHGVAVIVVDTVTSRTADLHAETMTALGRPGWFPVPDGSRLYAVAYRPKRRMAAFVDVWVEPIRVGSPLPTLPLWLSAADVIPLELEVAYTDACRRRRLPT